MKFIPKPLRIILYILTVLIVFWLAMIIGFGVANGIIKHIKSHSIFGLSDVIGLIFGLVVAWCYQWELTKFKVDKKSSKRSTRSKKA